MSKTLNLTAGWHELVQAPDPNGPGAANPIRTEQRRLAMGQSPRGRRRGLLTDINARTDRGVEVRDRARNFGGNRPTRAERRAAGNLPEGAPGRTVLHNTRSAPVCEYRQEHLGERARLSAERYQLTLANREADAMARFARRNIGVFDEYAKMADSPTGLLARLRRGRREK